MASSYTGLGTELMTTGENAGTWGSTTNTNLQIIEQISGGYVEQAISSTTTTLSVSDGSTGATLGHRIIKFTGTLSGNSTVTIPLDVQQMYILVNGTSGTYTLTFKYVSGSGDTVAFGTTDKGTKIVYAAADHASNPNMVDTGISTNTLTGVTGDITIDSPDDIVLDAAGGNIEFKDAGTTQLTLDMDTTASVQILKLGVNSDDLVFQQYDGNEVVRIADDRRLYFYDKGGEYIYGDGTDLHITSGADINIPANIGLTFGDDGEKIEGDGTDLTISGNNINLTATADVVIPANVGITFGTGEKIEGDSTDLTVTSGAKINLTATSDVIIPSGVGLILDGSGNEKIESDGTDISVSVGSGGDINIPSSIGVTFGDDGEKIEGDGTDLTIASSGVLNLAAGGTTNQIKVTDGAILPITDDDVDLGSSSYQFKDAYFDGTVEADAITVGGSAIVSSPITALNNATANELVTVGATTTELDAEANLTFDGTDVLLGGAGKLQLRDTGLYVASNADGDLDVVSDGTAVDSINLESAGGITLDAGTAASGIIYEDDGTEMLRIHNSSSDVIVESKVSNKDIIFKVNDGGTDTEVARFDGDVSALLLASGKKLMIGAAEEYISGDGTDISIEVGSGGDINIGSGIGLTFGNDGEKIEGDGTDLTISGNNINLTATADVVLAANTGLVLDGSGDEKIESDGTDITFSVGSNGDINIGQNVGLTFGDDGEKIEGDGTDLTISASALANIDAGTDIVLDADGGDIFFKDGGTTFGSATNTSGNLIIKSGTTTAATFSGANVTFAGTIAGGGTLTTGGNVVIPDAGNIGSASDTDAIAIASNGVVTFSQNPVFPDGGVAVADLDIDGATDIGEAIVDADLFIIDNGAGGTNRKVAASRIVTYIDANSSAATVGKAIAMAIVFG